MAKAPIPGKTRPKATQPGLVVSFGGDEWVLHPDAITPKDLADLRRATGLKSTDVFQAMADGDIPLDVFGALVFLARRQTEGKWINFDAATAGLTLGSECTIEPEPDEPEPDDQSPEA